MREVAEISCLACGRSLGSVERRDGATRLVPAPELPTTATVMRKPGTGLVCGRCGGRALMGPMERVAAYAA